MRKVKLIVISAMALCAIAPAQFGSSVIIPGIKVNKTKDNIEKKVKRGVVIYWYKNGQAFASRAVDMLPDPRTLADKKYEYAIYINVGNVFVEHMKVRPSPDPGMLNGKAQKVRGASNATRTVFNLPYHELDVYPGADKRNSFGGGLDFSGCRLGNNILEIVAHAKHAQQTEVDLLLLSGSNTTWRRNSLDDDLYFNVVDMTEDRLVVEAARNGWDFVNPELDQVAKGLAAMPVNMPSMQPGGSPPQGNTGVGQTNSQSANSSASATVDAKHDRIISFTLNSQSFTGGVIKNGDRLLVSSSCPFRLQAFSGTAEKPFKDTVYDVATKKGGFEALLDLTLRRNCRVEILDPNTGRMLGQTTLEVGK